MENLYEPPLDIDLRREFFEIACVDDKPDFVSMMKTLYESPTLESEKVGKGEPDDTEAKYCPRRIFDLIFGHGAVDCATALLEGETGFIVDLNLPNISGACPLHLAAEKLSYDMIDLFLRHGARTDIRTIDGVLKGDLLPLNIALEKLR
uniref:Uncharacterized protein n=1 Tax=Davidia involucrata TaxID=16924 RepID=A0A5B6YS69_DAVIN